MSTHDKLGDGRSAIAPIVWVPTAYIAEGIPFAVVIWTAGNAHAEHQGVTALTAEDYAAIQQGKPRSREPERPPLR